MMCVPDLTFLGNFNFYLPSYAEDCRHRELVLVGWYFGQRPTS